MKNPRLLLICGMFFLFTNGCSQKIAEEDFDQEMEMASSEVTDDGAVSESVNVTVDGDMTNMPMTAVKLSKDPVDKTIQDIVAASRPSEPSAPQNYNIVKYKSDSEETAKPTPELIQQALKNAGLYDGKIDGAIGPKTRKAIETFQSRNDLEVDGVVGRKTWAKLRSHLAE